MSLESLISTGRTFVQNGPDGAVHGRYASSLDSDGPATALKVGAHDTNPRNYREAMATDHAAEWYEAMCLEMNNIERNGTWRVVYLPAGGRAIGSRWVFKVKHLPDGSLDKFKARVVAQGFSQRPGLDYLPDETYAPTAQWSAIRTVLAIAAVEDMHLESVDIRAAFLHGIMPEEMEILMNLPEGFPAKPDPSIIKRPGDGRPVARLLKGLYGLKQGAYLWHKRMHEVFMQIGFKRIVADPCVYVYICDNTHIIIPIHVEDMTIAST